MSLVKIGVGKAVIFITDVNKITLTREPWSLFHPAHKERRRNVIALAQWEYRLQYIIFCP
jgi:hypothetical protein